MILSRLGSALLMLLIAGFAGAALVRSAPGFGTSEEQLDARLSHAGVEAARREQSSEKNPIVYYFGYLGALLKGDLGRSLSLNRPVSELIRERAPETLRAVAAGWGLGWTLALALSFAWPFLRWSWFDTVSTTSSVVFLCVPAAVLALLCVLAGAPAFLAIAGVIFPKAFRYSRDLVQQAYRAPHVLVARGTGIHPVRLFLLHAVPSMAPELIAFLGVTINLALTSAIPVEAVTGSPGLGQLAWQAALSRDLPLLVNMTLLLAAVTQIANLVADTSIAGWMRGRLA